MNDMEVAAGFALGFFFGMVVLMIIMAVVG